MDNIPAAEGGAPVREEKLYYAHQYIDEADINAVTEVLKSDYLTCGPAVSGLEEKLCSVTGAKYASVCTNGTAALHMACMALDIGAGDEVIVAPLTFAASANCVLYCGAKPVFSDVDPETYLLDPDLRPEIRGHLLRPGGLLAAGGAGIPPAGELRGVPGGGGAVVGPGLPGAAPGRLRGEPGG